MTLGGNQWRSGIQFGGILGGAVSPRRSSTQLERQDEALPRCDESEIAVGQSPGDDRKGEEPRRVNAYFDAEDAAMERD